MAKLGMLKNIRSRTGTRDSRSIALTVKDIPLGDISIKGNIRREYTGIEELAESIRQHGLLQPITVYADGDSYAVKTGHRRYLACKMLYGKEPERFHRIRRIVSDAANTAVMQLVENVQRVDLSQTGLFNALTGLRAQGMALRQIADVTGKTEGYIKSLFVGVNEINRAGGIR
jgi:ParB family chromosome partitioning protein